MNEANAPTTAGGGDPAAAGIPAAAVGESGPPTEPLDMTEIFNAARAAVETDSYI